jgi:hypothetical protein
VTVKTANGSPGIGSYEYDSAQKALSIKIVQSLYLNTAYTITVTSAVKDLAGNAIVPVTSTFSTDVCPKSRKSKPGFDGPIYAIAKIGCTLYVGGNFSSVGDAYAYGISLDSLTGKAPDGFTYEEINDYVYAAVSDGNGGWYIGGSFTQIGPYTRNRLAHILSNGEISPWNPSANGTVRSLALSGTTVYAGGDFTSIGGQARNRLAAIHTDGSLQAWNPDANSTVRAIAVSGSTVYAGGDFTSISGTARNRLAAIGTNGNLQSWDPNANDIVYALAVGGSTVYVGGNFTCFGNCPLGTEGDDKWTRNRLAAIGTDGVLQSWDPNANGVVRALAVSGSTVYAGGSFTTIGGATRNRLAAIGTNGSLQTWNPNASGAVRALAVTGSTVYAGGFFTSIGGQTRNHLAAIDSNGSLQSWNPNADNVVLALAVSGSTVYAGGQFTSIGGTARNRLAAIGTDGSLQSWNPNANSYVYALAVSGSTIYAGGGFTCFGNCPSGAEGVDKWTRNRLAAIGTNGSLQDWNPNANSTVNALAVSGSTVYAGGSFTSIGGTPRNRLAAIDIGGTCLTSYTSSCLQSWNPNASSTVNALAVSGPTVYAGGDFTTIGGTPRNYLAAIGTDGSLVTFWEPNANNPVYALAVSGSTVYAGGVFTQIGCNTGCSITGGPFTRNYLAAIGTDGSLQSWDPNADDYVYALAVSGSTVYAGGDFTSIGGATRNRLAAIHTDGSLQSWNPNANIGVLALAVSGSTAYVGGSFTSIGGIPRNRIVSINADGSVNW